MTEIENISEILCGILLIMTFFVATPCIIMVRLTMEIEDAVSDIKKVLIRIKNELRERDKNDRHRDY